ncbi:MAG TPA: SusD family outer membrane lipoprotein NanU, partial [Daejeonella sp.]
LNTLNAEFTGETNYGGFYSNINQINLLISKTISTSLISKSEKDYYLGQAYGMRALYYFHLLRSWGDVVIHKTPSASFKLDELSKPVSPAAEVMTFIKQDIDSSAVYFSTNYSFKSKVAWSKAATLMLKADAYLWSSRQMGGGTADAAIAKAALSDIQTNVSALGLLPNFKDVFAYGNKRNKEIVFAIHNALNEYTMFGGSYIAFMPRAVSTPNYLDSVTRGPITTSTHLLITVGGGFYIPIYRSVFWRFSNEDSRKLASINGAYRLEAGKYVLAPGLWVNKYQGVMNLGNREFVDDYPIYRYADLLLMLAEAKAILGENPANEINLVRQRAYGVNYKAAVHGYPNQPGDLDINEALLKERFFEFICEGKRWYDLRRFGKSYVFKYTTAKSDYQLLWPIDRATLTNNRALKQTPGY